MCLASLGRVAPGRSDHIRDPGPNGRGHWGADALGDGSLVPDGDAVARGGADASGVHGLTFAAAKTDRLRFRMLVGGVTYRHPGLLAKTMTTLDVLSEGRAELGLGAAWYEREHQGSGFRSLPSASGTNVSKRRADLLPNVEEDNGLYEAARYQLPETLCSPQPVSSPRPGPHRGRGERKTLRSSPATRTPAI